MDNEKIEKDNIVLDSKDLYIKEKLEKYKKGNFVLDSKHLYAKEKLEKIRDQMLDLIGGAKANKTKSPNKTKNQINNVLKANQQFKGNKQLDRIDQKSNNTDSDKEEKNSIDSVKNVMNKLEEDIKKNSNFLSNPEFDKFKNDITQNITTLPPNIKSSINMTDFSNLMQADLELVKIFQQYNDINSKPFDGIENKDKFKKTLLSIQKNLFKLQIKIIFNKLNLMKNNSNINITPIFEAINNKISNMYSFINNQETETKNKK